MRLAEFGTVYRWEQSGELNGMTRVRGFTQDDAHLFCTEEQLPAEILGCLALVKIILTTLGMSDYRVRVGLRDPDSAKYTGDPANWDKAEAACREAAKTLGVPFTEEPGEAAFYGPKIDFIVKDVIGREWQLGTVQVDYNLPQRFDLTYIGADNQPHRPVMIHRAPFGSMERFVGVLIEHFAGDFPAWLAPEQARVLPISEKVGDYAREVADRLKAAGFRVTLDEHADKLGAKIRRAEVEKVPYALVIGGKEAEAKTVAVRSRASGDEGVHAVRRLRREAARRGRRPRPAGEEEIIRWMAPADRGRARARGARSWASASLRRAARLSAVLFLAAARSRAGLLPSHRMMGSPHAPPRPPEPAAATPSRRVVALACGLLVLAVFAAYANSLSGPFVYDDKDSIVDNLTLRHLWPLSDVLAPLSGGLTVSGRPVLNLSLALNFAAGGLDVRGYHAANILIHALACLTLFGLVRRTLVQPSLRDRFGAAALPVAFTVAALWALHPLQTEAVTYIVQRAESLMGLFYLLTLYGFVRSVDAPAPGRWQALSVAACLLGMATKENMVSAPVLVLLLDRAFVAGSFAEAWRRRRGFYAALAATWILLGGLLASTGGNRGGSAGLGVDITWWAYALTQFPALVHYVRMSFWPTPLVFDYGTFWIGSLADVWPQACVVVALVAGTLVRAGGGSPRSGFSAGGFSPSWLRRRSCPG